jgi:acyl carrier protein
LDASFTTDLSLDSLDVVEVVMAIEEEFEVEIPDNIADSIKTPRQAVVYLTQQLLQKD